ncbi:MAG: tripartite tricarboxylate transporter substrate binding protein [Rubrivivax sp.]|jgi:tripartite-type tricarboxylate transporter receptor subunit TctC|nr:tripartite tricarboxylate transporter substrate binding protein [Rubrivivax sp.]
MHTPWAAVVLAAAVFATPVHAQQAFPTKPVRFVVPFSAGSGTDIAARAVGEVMARGLGQPVVIENRPGAGGTIAAAAVAKGESDGHTVLVPSSGHAVNPALYPNLAYDTLKDLTGVTPIVAMPNVLVVSPARGWKSVADLVAAAKARPGALNYASAGVGSATHFNAEKFRLQAGLNAVHVPFKGTPEAMTDVVGGRSDWFFAPLSSALSLIRDGKLQALAVSTARRSALLPDVPTTVEAGVPGSDYTFWVALVVPAATPAAAVARLQQEAAKALAQPELVDKLAKLGAEPMVMPSAEFNAFLRTEVEVAARVARAADLKAQ